MTHTKLIERLEEHAHWRNAVARTVPEKTAALLREAAAALREREWQSMDSAPKDGTQILVRGPTAGGGFYHDVTAWPVNWSGMWPTAYMAYADGNEPTAWMPLPTPPETVK